MRAPDRSLPVLSRAFLLLAALCTLGALVLPLWRIDLDAPQYPEGIGMVIRASTIEGAKPNDLQNINGLNHYIGMRAIEPESIPELRFMPRIIVLLAALAVGVALLNRRSLIVAWLLLFGAAGIAGLYDFWRWGYEYGHELDPRAIIKIPGMVYQPPLIGSKQLLNFTAHSWPASGGMLLGLAFGLGGIALLVALRRCAIPDAARLATAGALMIATTACAKGTPRDIAYGSENCGFCRMSITDTRFGTEVELEGGRAMTFDSIECLAGFVAGNPAARITGVWVTDLAHPGTLVSALRMNYWEVPGLSPMGHGLVAAMERPDGASNATPMHWQELVDRTRAARPAKPDSSHALVEPAHPASSDSVVVVSPYGDPRTVSEALRRVRAGGRVIVQPGVYREPTLIVDRPVTLEGQGMPTLHGSGTHGVLAVRADDVTVRGFRFAGTGIAMTEDRAAIRITESARCAVTGNHFDSTFFGVYLAKVADCRIQGNHFTGVPSHSESTSGNAIHLWSARDVDVIGNHITGHRDGIYFEFVRHGRVAANLSEANLRYGLHFMYSDSCTYESNSFRANGAGVAVMYTNTVSMTNNLFADNRGAAAYGLLLKEIADPTLRGNDFAGNSVALMADGATRLVATGNRFRANGWAIRLMSNVQDARFTGNDFSANTFDVSTNGEAAGATFLGNYFAEYRGYDLDRNGRGDAPHRPVRLLSHLVTLYEPALVLQRSFFVGLLDAAERAIPSLTPVSLVDESPSMHPLARPGHGAPRGLMERAPHHPSTDGSAEARG